MSEKIARFYVADRNPDGASLPAVPLRDLTEEEFGALPEWLQRSVDACPFYRKTKVPAEKAPETVRPATPTPEKET